MFNDYDKVMFNYNLLSSAENDIDSKKKYVIFGDSHSQFFTGRNHENLEIHLYRVPGASMAGFGKKQSTLKVADTIRQTIYYHQDLDLLILKFGQVDVELGYYYRLVVKKESVDFTDFAEKIVSMYFDFIKSLDVEKRRIYVLGINLPSIFKKNNAIRYTSPIITKNVQDGAEVKSLKKDLVNCLPEIDERTNRSLIFNEILNSFCHKNNVGYGDFLKETIDEETGRLKGEFHLREDNDPHFRDGHSTRKLYADKLQLISLEQDKNAIKIVNLSQPKPLENKLIKLRQWQVRLEDIKNKLKQIH